MIDRRARALILAATLVLAGAYEAVFTPMAHAQTSKGILAGTVRDSQRRNGAEREDSCPE